MDSSALEALIKVAKSHGVELTIEALRSAYVSISSELPTATLIAIASDAGLEAKSIHPKWRDLPRLGNVLPAIVRLKDGGAAILRSVGNNEQIGQLVLLESAEGEEVPLDEASLTALWTGEIVLIKRRFKVA